MLVKLADGKYLIMVKEGNEAGGLADCPLHNARSMMLAKGWDNQFPVLSPQFNV